MANPFAVNVPAINPLGQLMAGYNTATGMQDASNQRQARLAAQDALLNGGDTQSALARLLGAGDTKGAAVLATMENAQRYTNGVYGTPIYGTDANGNTVLGAIGKNGTFQRLDTGGITPTPGVRFLDTGTGYVPMNSRTGARMGGAAAPGQPSTAQTGVVQPVQVPQIQTTPGYIPKDLAGAAQQKKFGTEQGDAQGRLASMSSKLPGLQTVVEQLKDLANKATYTLAGQAINYGMKEMGLAPREAAVARTRYDAIVNNQILPMLRDTFGAQFTAREGDTLKSTLGDPNKTPQEKQAVLQSFIDQKVRDVQALERQMGGQMQQPVQAGGYQEGTRARNPQTGQVIELRGGQWVPVQ